MIPMHARKINGPTLSYDYYLKTENPYNASQKRKWSPQSLFEYMTKKSKNSRRSKLKSGWYVK